MITRLDRNFIPFHTKSQSGHAKGKPTGTEVTGGYCGSNNNVEPVSVTTGVDGDGKIIRRTEDQYSGHHVSGLYNELTPKGTAIAGVSHIPEFNSGSGIFNKEFDIVWCADKDGGNVTFRR